MNTILDNWQNTSSETMQGEIWLPMPNQKKMRVVSNLGRIGHINGDGRVIITKQNISRNSGYVCFQINKEWHDVKSCVAEAFMPAAGDKKEIGHINGIATDNRYANLEYCEKCSDELIAPYVLCDFKKIPSLSASVSPVVKVSINGERLAAYRSIKEASEFERVTKNKIHSLINATPSEYSFRWLSLDRYFKTDKFKKQAQYIISQQTKIHPWLLNV